MEHPVFYATTVFRARGCIRLLRIRDLRYGRTLSGSKNLKSGRKKHPSPSTRPQPQKRATFLIAAAAASINLLLLLLLGICHLGSYNNIFLANYAYVYTMHYLTKISEVLGIYHSSKTPKQKSCSIKL